MEDRVADVLAERTALENGSAVAIALSVFAHAGLSALAIWGALRSTPPQAASVMNIKFAPIASALPAAPRVAPAAPAKRVTAPVPVPVAKPIEKPVLPSQFGRSTKKATELPPAPVTSTAPATNAPTTTAPDIAIGGTGVTALEGGDFPYTLYIESMKRIIGSHWLRPPAANGITTTVYFEINRDGSIREAKNTMPSNVSTFDRAALRAVLESSPLPPLPFGYSGTYLGVHLTFR